MCVRLCVCWVIRCVLIGLCVCWVIRCVLVIGNYQVCVGLCVGLSGVCWLSVCVLGYQVCVGLSGVCWVIRCVLGYQVCVRLSGVCWVIIKCVYVCVGVGFVLGLSYVLGL